MTQIITTKSIAISREELFELLVANDLAKDFTAGNYELKKGNIFLQTDVKKWFYIKLGEEEKPLV